ncbi:MAG TPA: PKD domain-containing protein [Candidatus Thermoplasmatota archaeon]
MGGKRRLWPRWTAATGFCVLAAAAALLAVSSPVAGGTLVPAGNLTANEAWSSGGSPYQLLGVLRVPAGITLSVDAGVTVEYNASSSIVVEGSLNVTGSGSSRVVFGPNGNTPCLELAGGGAASIRYATFDRCNDGLLIGAGASADVSNTVFTGTRVTAIAVQGNAGPVLLSTVEVEDGLRGVSVSGGRARLSATGLHIHDVQYCVRIVGASDVSLRSPRLGECSKAAVELSSASWVNVTDGTITGWAEVAVTGNRVDHLNLSGNTMTGGTSATRAVLLTSADNCTIANNAVAALALGGGMPGVAGGRWGIEIASPSGVNTISGNTITRWEYGLLVGRATSAQVIAGNEFREGTETGLWLRDSTGAVVTGNRWTGERFPFEVSTTGLDLPQHYRHTVALSNLVDGRPILYLVDASGVSFDLGGGAAIVVLAGARNVTLTGGSLENGLPSLLVVDSADVSVTGTRLTSWWKAAEVVRSARVVLDRVDALTNLTCFGFRDGADNRLVSSSATQCAHAVLTEGSEQGLVVDGLHAVVNSTVALFEGTNLTVRDSTVQDCRDLGVANAKYLLPRESVDINTKVAPLYGAPTALTLENVSVGNCPTAVTFRAVGGLTMRGVQVVQADVGVELIDVTGISINGSEVSARLQGVHGQRVVGGAVEGSSFAGTLGTGLACTGCANLTIASNLFLSNGQGLSLFGGAGCVVTRNEFYDNTAPASTNTTAHAWDDGAVGNLWDSYTGVDSDGDGIGETPFVVSSGPFGTAQDNYPIAFRPDAVPPEANAGPDQTVDEDVRVYFSGYQSTDDIQVRVHLWSFFDGGALVTLAGVSVWYVFEDPGRYTVTLTVIDWGGNRATDTLTVTVRDRTGPAADAGGDRTVDEDVPVLLDGLGTTDNDRDFPAGAVYRWQVFDRQGVSTLLAPQANWTFAIPGRYRVTLEVRDAAGNAGFDEAWITVRDTTPPTVPPLTAPVAEEDFPFSAYGSLVTDNDPDWPAGRVEWFELWAQGVLVARYDGAPGRFQVATPGTYTVFYFVGDAAGNTGRANVTFRVKDVTPPDLSLYGVRQEEAGATLTFDLSLASDNDPEFPLGADATWSIRLPAGTVVLRGPSVTYAFQWIGEFVVTLYAQDADRNPATTMFQVKVEDTRGPSIRIEGPATVEAGSTAAFFANASDPSGLGQISWAVTGREFPLSGALIHYLFARPGLYQLTASVADTYGNPANTTWTVTVVDTTPPPAVVALTPGLDGGAVRLRVNESLSASFLGADAVGVARVMWSWDDGSFGEGATADHAWGEAGTYTVVVHASDEAGNLNSTSITVIVEALPSGGPPEPPQGGTTAPPVPTAQLLSPWSLVLAAVGAGAGAWLGFLAARRHSPGR